MPHVTVREALERVADDYDAMPTEWVQVPVHELIGRTLFQLANPQNTRVRGTVTKATRAQKLILDRMVGTRRPGTNPAARKGEAIEFTDLTEGSIAAAPKDETTEEADNE